MAHTNAVEVNDYIFANFNNMGSHLDRITSSYTCFPSRSENSS